MVLQPLTKQALQILGLARLRPRLLRVPLHSGPSPASWAINLMVSGLERICHSNGLNFMAETTSGSPRGIMTFQTALAHVGVDYAADGADAVSANEKDFLPRRTWLGKAERTARVKVASLWKPG